MIVMRLRGDERVSTLAPVVESDESRNGNEDESADAGEAAPAT